MHHLPVLLRCFKSGANCAPSKRVRSAFMCSQFCYCIPVHAILPSHETLYFKGTLNSM